MIFDSKKKNYRQIDNWIYLEEYFGFYSKLFVLFDLVQGQTSRGLSRQNNDNEEKTLSHPIVFFFIFNIEKKTFFLQKYEQ